MATWCRDDHKSHHEARAGRRWNRQALGLLQIDERASLDGDTMRFSPASVSLMGGSVPSSLQSTIDSRLTVQHSLSDLPGHLTPSSLKITDQGISVGLAAGPTQLDMGSSGEAAKAKCPSMNSKL